LANFVLPVADLPSIKGPKEVESTLEILYRHARKCAPGLEVPYCMPKVTIWAGMDIAGEYVVNDGWVSVRLASEHLGNDSAIRLILAHEACHHILDISGLADKRNSARNERMTDLAMFICGFGEIAAVGYRFAEQKKDGWVTTHLGYLRPEEYSAAHEWVLEARRVNGLSGAFMGPASHKRVELVLPTASEECLKDLTGRMLGDKQKVKRLLEDCKRRFPDLTEEQRCRKVIEEHERIRR